VLLVYYFLFKNKIKQQGLLKPTVIKYLTNYWDYSLFGLD